MVFELLSLDSLTREPSEEVCLDLFSLPAREGLAELVAHEVVLTGRRLEHVVAIGVLDGLGQLALDDLERNALAGHLDRMSVSEPMRGKRRRTPASPASRRS